MSGSLPLSLVGLMSSRSGVAALASLSEEGWRRSRARRTLGEVQCWTTPLTMVLSMAASANRPPMTDAPP